MHLVINLSDVIVIICFLVLFYLTWKSDIDNKLYKGFWIFLIAIILLFKDKINWLLVISLFAIYLFLNSFKRGR